MSVLSPAIVFYSSDMEEVVHFYRLLGVIFEKEKHDDGPIHYACGLGGLTIEIYPRKGRVPHSDRLRAIDYRIVLPVENLEATLKSIRHLIEELVSPRETIKGKSTLITDPDGRHILLIEKQR